MPRKGPAPRRSLNPDPIYRSVLVTQIVNKVLERGKRSLAERLVYDAMDLIKDRSDGDPVAVVKRAVENTKPQLEVKSRRVGGATYQVPIEVRGPRANTLSIRSMPPTASAPRSSAGRTCTRWPSPTRRSPTTGGSGQWSTCTYPTLDPFIGHPETQIVEAHRYA
jgi:small subunit ribosomal protein S7